MSAEPEAGGEVLALAEFGILRIHHRTARNLTFLQNLARYARSR